MDGSKSQFKDCLQQSKTTHLQEVNQFKIVWQQIDGHIHETGTVLLVSSDVEGKLMLLLLMVHVAACVLKCRNRRGLRKMDAVLEKHEGGVVGCCF